MKRKPDEVVGGLSNLKIGGDAADAKKIRADSYDPLNPILPCGRVSASPPQAPTPTPMAIDHTDWFALDVVDARTNTRIKDAKLKLKLPGDNTVEPVTPDAGQAMLRYDTLPPGTTSLEELSHADLWELVEITSA